MNASKLVENWLKDQGFRCKRDEDNDLAFRYEGINMICSDDDDDEQFLRIFIPAIYKVDGDREKVLEAISAICRDIKCVKAFLVEDYLWLTIEQLIDSTPDIEDFIERCLDILIAARRKASEEILG